MWKEIRRALRIGAVFVLHLVLLTVALAVLRLGEIVWTALFPHEDPILGGYLPLHVLIQISEWITIVAFLISSLISAIKAFFRDDD